MKTILSIILMALVVVGLATPGVDATTFGTSNTNTMNGGSSGSTPSPSGNDGESIRAIKTSGGFTCKTQWAFDGKSWVKRDLVAMGGKLVIDGNRCRAWDAMNRKPAPEPRMTPATVGDTTPLPSNWMHFDNRILW